MNCRSSVLVVSALFREICLYMLQHRLPLIRDSERVYLWTMIEPHVSNYVNGYLRQDSGVICQDEGIRITCYMRACRWGCTHVGWQLLEGLVSLYVSAYALDDIMTVGHLGRFPEPGNHISRLGSASCDGISYFRARIGNSIQVQ
jgi:hypothetical protein